MSKNGILHRGDSYSLSITVTDQTGTAVDWDTITNFSIRIYSLSTQKVMLSAAKDDLTIDDPATGIATLEIPATATENAELDLYVLEYKYKTSTEERSEKGYWGRFVQMKMEKNHFLS